MLKDGDYSKSQKAADDVFFSNFDSIVETIKHIPRNSMELEFLLTYEDQSSFGPCYDTFNLCHYYMHVMI